MNRIAIINQPGMEYPIYPPFHPSQSFPEYPWEPIDTQPNHVYQAVRQSLVSMGLDQENYDTALWNPFKEFIHPGNTILIKPNFVLHFNASGNDISSLVTHSSVIRAALDYTAIALGKRGKIIIGDAPIQSCRIENLLRMNGLQKVIDFFRENSDIEIDFQDMREEVIKLEKHSVISSRHINPVQLTEVRLGVDSKLEGIIQDAHLFCVESYEQNITLQAHLPGSHIYDLNSITFDVDAIINIPKLKTHKKAGMTGAIKNFVGLNANKDKLPHFRSGSPLTQGDEYPFTNTLREVYRRLIRVLDGSDNRVIRYTIVSVLFVLRQIFQLQKFNLIEGGSWPGNDTLWRTINDLTKIIYYGNANGEIMPEIQRKVFHLVDGVVAGEKLGPLRPSPKQSGLIITGFNPFLVDAAACELMGFDYRSVKSVAGMQDLFPIDPTKAEIFLNSEKIPFTSLRQQIIPTFIPAYGWDEILAN